MIYVENITRQTGSLTRNKKDASNVGNVQSGVIFTISGNGIIKKGTGKFNRNPENCGECLISNSISLFD